MTSVLPAEEMRTLLDSIKQQDKKGDPILIAFRESRIHHGGWVRLHEKGGKHHDMPAHHKAEEYVDAYLDAARLRDQKNGPIFRTAIGNTKLSPYLLNLGSSTPGRGRTTANPVDTIKLSGGRRIGAMGMRAISKIVSMLLAAIAVNMIRQGLAR